jgi:hypothetical protein
MEGKIAGCLMTWLLVEEPTYGQQVKYKNGIHASSSPISNFQALEEP